MTILVLVLLAIAFCEAQENVALGGVAVSSDDGNTGVFAFDAVDGDEFTCFHIRGELDTDLWWQVDLGGKSVHRIDRVEINTTHNFTGQECGLLLRNFQNVDTNNYVTGFFELMGVKTEDGCCSACLQKDTCEMWRLDSNGCWLYALQDIQWTDGQSIAYRNGDGGHPSIFLYGATVRAGPESGHDLNPNCGEDVSLAHTVDSLLVRHCDQRFGRYVSISSSLGQLKFCEVAVYAEHVNYVDLGCYKDDPNLLSLEENTLVSDLLDGLPSERENAFDKCAFAAQRLQYMVFSLKNGGECFSGPDAGLTCDRSAKLDSCISLDASSIPINLYLIVDTPSEQIFANRYVRIGCYAENADDPTMASLEKSHPRLQDNYKQRSLPGRKCASVAAEMNFLIFALHNGGKCLADANGWARYDKYGASDECVKGKGGRHAITVYAIVHTRDTEAPNVSCSDIRQATSPESDIAFVEAESNVQVSDNVDFHGDFTRNCLPSLVDGLGIGPHPVTCSLIDRSGNEASCDFIVTVIDEESPIGSCPDVEEPTLQ
ncbi:uncharacterized protein [Ptychodera flava]|uniref:uncharacterized protein n=1 Tax=Ptychodera flava TaxID=63121 RepID=UPI00396A9799